MQYPQFGRRRRFKRDLQGPGSRPMEKAGIELDRMTGTSLPGELPRFDPRTGGLMGETTLSAGEKGCPGATPSPRRRHGFANIVGKSEAMQAVYDLISKGATTDANVVIYGESGTGKELVAQAIHHVSHRRDRAFVPVNCGAIPETLLESEFFGHRKGAFTGAYMDKHGYLDLAHGGTLFLDEVGDLSLNIQVKLLRAIDCKRYFPVGSNRAKSSDFRIIAATNSDLMEKVRKGLMREDFFYRIHVIPI
ncbi:MAG: sigma-54 factor interaction domain-containing protein, partial [Deltaproteobacteria bacterium]|nr:sigma-54 factor interaction domain-containing protein [Deltaproteobacteria bacterium]